MFFVYYIRQVNGVKLTDTVFILACLCVCVCVCICAHSVQFWRIYALSERLLILYWNQCAA